MTKQETIKALKETLSTTKTLKWLVKKTNACMMLYFENVEDIDELRCFSTSLALFNYCVNDYDNAVDMVKGFIETLEA